MAVSTNSSTVTVLAFRDMFSLFSGQFKSKTQSRESNTDSTNSMKMLSFRIDVNGLENSASVLAASGSPYLT